MEPRLISRVIVERFLPSLRAISAGLVLRLNKLQFPLAQLQISACMIDLW